MVATSLFEFILCPKAVRTLSQLAHTVGFLSDALYLDPPTTFGSSSVNHYLPTMATHRMEPRPPSRKWQSLLSKIRARLNTCGLLHVLESFPPATSFSFYEATILKRRAIKLHLGFRNQVNAPRATSWAYIVLEGSEFDPPVIFRDEIAAASGIQDQPQLIPRAASSLLRKAEDLFVPVRFLQFDPHETSVRNMLCALVLYYSLVNGLCDLAIGWGAFEGSLVKALEYIDSNLAYSRWRNEQLGSNTSIEAPAIKQITSATQSSNAKKCISSAETKIHGGVVCSNGSSVLARAGTTLAKLREVLGDKFQLVDALPPIPVRIERQNAFPTYFPFRLHLGRYRNCEVYVYFKLDLRRTSTIVAQNEVGETWTWTFLNLQQLQLFEPFSFIMRLSNLDLRTRGNKIRYLVYYYFMLAENEGIIDDLQLRGSFPSMIPSFCSACRDLERVSYTASGLVDEARVPQRTAADDQERLSSKSRQNFLVVCDKSTAKRESMILKIRIQPKALSALVESNSPSQHSGSDEIREEDSEKISGKLSHPEKVFNEVPLIPSIEVQPPSQQDATNGSYVTKLPNTYLHNLCSRDAQSPTIYEQKSSRESSRDSGFASSSALSDAMKDAYPVPSDQQQPPNFLHKKNVPQVIDISSDGEGILYADSSGNKAKGTPEIEEVVLQRKRQPHRSSFEVPGDEELRLPAPRKSKRKATYVIRKDSSPKRKTSCVISDEDDSCQEVGRDIWLQVSHESHR
ncbi:hypothetical protein GQ44DRAFT_702880 [Phaeosphaeriaceae sp. PMI808]|nr:hypothetical protein GQ44DRAFT_702880 [Phaeosphaeriaceae sp. PMI808]